MIQDENNQGELYTPAAGHHLLTPLYDLGVALTTREALWRNRLVELLSPQDDDVILDIGAGTDSLATLLAKRNPATRYFGIDPDQAAIDIAQAKAAREETSATFKVAHFSKDAVSSWPTPTKATLCLVLHQVPLDEKLRLLRAIHSTLDAGGILFIADYSEQRSWLMRMLFRSTIQRLDGVSDTQPNADGVLVPLMAQAGFVQIEEPAQFNTITGSISILKGTKSGRDT
jgi:ubiquinone/menaquinone biosynthesis C-methylase UbiE